MILKKLFRKWKWLGYAESILLVVVGALVMCFYSNTQMQNIIGYIVGVYLLLNAVLLIVSSLAFNIGLLDGDFISGLFFLTIAIWLFVEPSVLINSLPLILGVILIAYGLIMVIKGLIMIPTKVNVGGNIAVLIAGCLMVVLGTTIISLQYSGSVDVGSFILLISGILMVILGISEFINVAYISRSAHKVNKAISNDKDVVSTQEDKR